MVFKMKLYHDPVRELLAYKYDRNLVDNTLNWGEHIYYDGDGNRTTPYFADEDTRTAIEDEHTRLINLSKEALAAEYEELRDRKLAEQEESQWYNRPSYKADFVYWSKMPFWTIEEGLILTTGRDPAQVSKEKVDKKSSGYTLAEFLRSTVELANRNISVGRLNPQNSPHDFLSWAKESQISCSVPDALQSAVETFGAAPPASANTESDFDTSSIQTRKATNPDPRYVRTLQKMIIAMAVDCYGFNPSDNRSGVVNDIANALASVGLSVSEDTIRSALKKAAKHLPSDPEE